MPRWLTPRSDYITPPDSITPITTWVGSLVIFSTKEKPACCGVESPPAERTRSKQRCEVEKPGASNGFLPLSRMWWGSILHLRVRSGSVNLQQQACVASNVCVYVFMCVNVCVCVCKPCMQTHWTKEVFSIARFPVALPADVLCWMFIVFRVRLHSVWGLRTFRAGNYKPWLERNDRTPAIRRESAQEMLSFSFPLLQIEVTPNISATLVLPSCFSHVFIGSFYYFAGPCWLLETVPCETNDAKRSMNWWPYCSDAN